MVHGDTRQRWVDATMGKDGSSLQQILLEIFVIGQAHSRLCKTHIRGRIGSGDSKITKYVGQIFSMASSSGRTHRDFHLLQWEVEADSWWNSPVY